MRCPNERVPKGRAKVPPRSSARSVPGSSDAVMSSNCSNTILEVLERAFKASISASARVGGGMAKTECPG